MPRNIETSLDFLRFSLGAHVLRFGSFRTKAGRDSPYFFNAGLFNSGALIEQLGNYYADTIIQKCPPFDLLFGPAYKGIPLATTAATALARRHERDVPLAYNRKEAKDHGEGGNLVGAPVEGRVLIIDDVISAGTSIRESAGWIEQAGAAVAGVVIALDRQEKGTGNQSAVQEVEQMLGVPVIAIAQLTDLIRLLENDPSQVGTLAAIHEYRDRYGA
ncbi:MAG: orotate phosphoribosyltransferase [Magnetococcales bacterium]|nr:orotate phosphoribosyltransferase [Magnetococcales bacterium]